MLPYQELEEATLPPGIGIGFTLVEQSTLITCQFLIAKYLVSIPQNLTKTKHEAFEALPKATKSCGDFTLDQWLALSFVKGLHVQAWKTTENYNGTWGPQDQRDPLSPCS